MTKNKAINEAKTECRKYLRKRVAGWIVKDNTETKEVNVQAYSAGTRCPVITKKYD